VACVTLSGLTVQKSHYAVGRAQAQTTEKNMQIIFHLGAHSTDDDKLLQSLLKDQKALAEHGVVVPRPWRYRPILRETLIALAGAEATPEIQEVVLDAAMDADEAERVVLVNENFISAPPRVVSEEVLYPNAAEKTQWLRRVFPRHEVEFFMAMRNPATFFPAMAARLKDVSPQEMLATCNPAAQRWSDVFTRIREANPDVPLTVWCNEDTPLIWTELLRELTDQDASFAFSGQSDLVNALMSEDGVRRMASYLESHPPANENQRRRIVAAFLEKFGLPEALEEELDLPGWTEDYVEMLTAAYEDDMYEVARIPGVKLITP